MLDRDSRYADRLPWWRLSGFHEDSRKTYRDSEDIRRDSCSVSGKLKVVSRSSVNRTETSPHIFLEHAMARVVAPSGGLRLEND